MINLTGMKELQKIHLCKRAKKEWNRLTEQLENITPEEYKEIGYGIEFELKALESIIKKLKLSIKHHTI